MSKKLPQPTHIICILDASGSMSSSIANVRKSFNVFVEEQAKERGDAVLTLIKFHDYASVIYSKVPIKEVPQLTSKEYYTAGCTALYDAIGEALDKNDDKKAFVLIQTDGYENQSSHYTKQKIKTMIEKKEKQGWDFLFLGADIDASSVGSELGLEGKTLQFNKSARGIETVYSAMSAATSNYRADADQVKLVPKDVYAN